MSIAGDGAVNQARVQRAHLRCAQAQSIGHSGSKVFEQDVRLCDQAAYGFKTGFLLHVDGEAALVAAQPHVSRRQPAHRGVPVTDEIAHSRFFHLDDIGAHIPQNPGAKRTGHGSFQRHDAHATEGQRRALRLIKRHHSFTSGKRSCFGACAFFQTITLRA